MSKDIDSFIFDIEDYIGGNIEGVESVDRMGLTVFLRNKLEEQRQSVISDIKGMASGATFINPIDGEKESVRFVPLSAIEDYEKRLK